MGNKKKAALGPTIGPIVLGMILVVIGMAIAILSATSDSAGHNQERDGLIAAAPFVVLGLVFLIGGPVATIRSRRAEQRRKWLLERGIRVPGVLVDVTEDRPAGDTHSSEYTMTYESRSGGRHLRVVERSVSAPPVGRKVTIAFDEADPRRAVVVENYGEEQREHARQYEIEQRAMVDQLLKETEKE
ncbi:MAG: DUF3592 domain-containing protein [Kibdelosporangium sp.]